MRIAFSVVGTPRPKGSKKTFVLRRKDGSFITRPGGAPIVNTIEDNPNTAEWRGQVALAAQAAMNGSAIFVGRGLRVVVVYRFVRPAGHYGKRGLKPSAPRHHTVKPDIDKLDRNTRDALKGLVYDDDARIVRGESTKVYCAPGEVAGADILVELLEAPAELADDTQPALAFGG